MESEIAQSVQMMIEEGLEVPVVEATDYLVDLDKPWHILEANAAVDEGDEPRTRTIGDPSRQQDS